MKMVKQKVLVVAEVDEAEVAKEGVMRSGIGTTKSFYKYPC